jgi:phosphoglycolate phosphatase
MQCANPLVIFDLDGTLADSFPWFLRNVNGVAEKFSFRRIAIEATSAAPSRPRAGAIRRQPPERGSNPAGVSHPSRYKGVALLPQFWSKRYPTVA